MVIIRQRSSYNIVQHFWTKNQQKLIFRTDWHIDIIEFSYPSVSSVLERFWDKSQRKRFGDSFQGDKDEDWIGDGDGDMAISVCSKLKLKLEEAKRNEFLGR